MSPCPHPPAASGQGMLPLEKALAALLACAGPVEQTLSLPLLEADRRVCAADIYAGLPQPPFDRAQVDGYAARSADLAGASPEAPARLLVTQFLYAGSGPGQPMQPGQAARITTGAMLPPGADCVIWQEDITRHGHSISVRHSLASGRNCHPKGHDVAPGRLLAGKGHMLHSGTLGLLAGQGLTHVSVYGTPAASMLATGDELCPPGLPLPKGGIYNTSTTLLGVRLQRLGAHVADMRVCPDDDALLLQHMEDLLPRSALVITTGGVSWGPRDLVPRLTARLMARHGGRLLFRGLTMKPGAMTLGAVVGKTILLGLSGTPVAAAAAFELLAGPLIKKLSGRTRYGLTRQHGIMSNDFGTCRKDARRLIMARIEGTDVFMRPRCEGAGWSALRDDCNCFVDIPAGSLPLRRGDEVNVILP